MVAVQEQELIFLQKNATNTNIQAQQRKAATALVWAPSSGLRPRARGSISQHTSLGNSTSSESSSSNIEAKRLIASTVKKNSNTPTYSNPTSTY